MIKGTRKQMIVLRTAQSSRFEAAYFILREREEGGAHPRDILREANQILADADSGNARPRASGRRIFCIGLLCGTLIASILLFTLLCLLFF